MTASRGQYITSTAAIVDAMGLLPVFVGSTTLVLRLLAMHR